MSIKLRLTAMSFMQFFVWGAWLTTLGTYGFVFKKWSGQEFGAVFSTLGIASIFMPALMGIIADRWMNLEKLYGVLHILYGATLFVLAGTDNPVTFFWILLGGMCFYMPTISLSNALSYKILKDNDYDVIKVFPPIRVWGTIGFIVAMWITNLFSDTFSPLRFGIDLGTKFASIFGNSLNANQFYFAGIGAILLGLYSFSLPKCPPMKLIDKDAPLSKKLGLDAFRLLGDSKMALFFFFSMFLGAALQLTNMYGDTYLKDFKNIPEYADSVVVRYSTMIVSISQISETLFILAIPFFLKRFGIKNVILISMFAWVLRFGFFAFGAPESFGLFLIVLSNIIYGMAFDFFNISGSLFVETTTDSKIRSSAQGVFMMMTNGFGAILGSSISGYVIQNYFTVNGLKDWHGIWFSFAVYALVVAVAFAVLFKHKHDPADVAEVAH
ncbi:nucleoside permease [Flavobacterium sp.]|uniref:nucleoside permease n=1 Tax=Flavobacterium sp. TaxID=239 RepID=UPI00120982BD|nr:nucleoside permease [Flavobacterium sp.]RZJ70123.1 MAG: MFS transporter [Flavobacterium sp.]